MNTDDRTPSSLPHAEDMPRERLLREGRAALTDEELIALFLRTGSAECHVLELAARLKREAGSLALLASLEAQEIQSLCKGIGVAKAAALAAVFELGRRAMQEEASGKVLAHPRAVYEFLAPELHALRQETLVLLLLDIHRRLIAKRTIGTGSLSQVLTHPRDIFRETLRYNAYCIVLAHNHPSGFSNPSEADIQMTNAVARTSGIMRIPLDDHVIIGRPGKGCKHPYYSFREDGRLP